MASALVTGGGRGIGANIARALARTHHPVTVTGRTTREVEAVADEDIGTLDEEDLAGPDLQVMGVLAEPGGQLHVDQIPSDRAGERPPAAPHRIGLVAHYVGAEGDDWVEMHAGRRGYCGLGYSADGGANVAMVAEPEDLPEMARDSRSAIVR